jgi:hypothetical protein
MQGRHQSLRKHELIHSPASQYPATPYTTTFQVSGALLGVQGWRAKAKPMYFLVIVAAGDFAIATAPTPLISLAECGKI